MLGVEFNRNQRLALWTLIGLSAIGFSFVQLKDLTRFSSGEVVIREPSESSIDANNKSSESFAGDTNPYAGKVVFQVAGCVKKPGVYQLPVGERVIKAILAAGGPKENADLQAINLATKIEDGSRIYVPSIEETRYRIEQEVEYPKLSDKTKLNGLASRSKAIGSGSKLRIPGEGIVHINSADVEELQRLPGVGPATAEKILEYRSRVGKFTQPEQLMDVKGIGPKTFEKMRPFVAL